MSIRLQYSYEETIFFIEILHLLPIISLHASPILDLFIIID